MHDAIVTALIGAAAATVGAILVYASSNRRVRVESISAEAAAELSRAQASDLMWENLTAAYQAATQELKELREEVRELPALRAEVRELRTQMVRFEAIIDGLPDEYRDLFAPVRRKARAAPKAPAAGGE